MNFRSTLSTIALSMVRGGTDVRIERFLMSWEITPSKLESERFGIVAAKLRVKSSDSIAQAVEDIRCKGIEFVSIRVPVADLRLVQSLEKYGFFLTDTLVYYRKKLSPENKFPSRERPYSLRIAVPDDHAKIIQVAGLSFEGYIGHYHSDTKFDSKKADEVYVDWIRRSCHEGLLAHDIFITEEDGEVTSFATVKKDGSRAEGVLFGVHPEHQGKGIYRELITASMKWGIEAGCDEIYYSTQINNIAVQKVWAREGCELDSAYYTFHFWAQ